MDVLMYARNVMHMKYVLHKTNRPVDYEDEEYDTCGNTTHAVLKVNGIKIPLCGNCLQELNQSLKQLNNTTFCYKCANFIMSKWGVELRWEL